jgi:hypothetical protein
MSYKKRCRNNHNNNDHDDNDNDAHRNKNAENINMQWRKLPPFPLHVDRLHCVIIPSDCISVKKLNF